MKRNHQPASADTQHPGKDRLELLPSTFVMDMSDVKDIPGQENIQVPRLREMQDMTVSSADEEGEGLLDELNTTGDNIEMDNRSNVTATERKFLQKSAGHQPTAETVDFNNMVLDETDADGDALNEKGIRQDRTGEDLDTPGTDLDDEDENIGEEDEENNTYSLPD